MRFSLLGFAAMMASAAVPAPAQQTILENFESATVGSPYMFGTNQASGSNGGVGTITHSVVTEQANTDLDPAAGPLGSKSIKVQWTWTTASGGRFRYTTSGGTGRINPAIKVDQGLSLYGKITAGKTNVSLIVRETGSNVGIGGNGGAVGNLERTAVATAKTLDPAADSTWTYLFWGNPALSNLTWANFNGGNGTLSATNNEGVLEALYFEQPAGVPAGTVNTVYLDDFYQGPSQSPVPVSVSAFSID